MNRITTVATIAAVPTIGTVGQVGLEAEEAEAEEAEAADSSLEARLAKLEAEADSPFTETELAERERKFRYLKEFRKRKRFEHRLDRQDEARAEMRAEVDRIPREEAERSTRESEGTMSEEAMMESAGVGIAYLEVENGKLTKRRTTVLRRTPLRKMPARRKTPADGIRDDIYVQDETGDVVRYVPPPRRFTQADRERVNKNRDRRHSRIWYAKQLLAVAEGRLILTKEQYHALIAFGRLKGW